MGKVMGLLALGLMLCGCAPWRGAAEKTRADYQLMRTEEQERTNYAACVNQGAMPGSAENLACQLEMARKEQGAKPQIPPAKSP